MPTLWGCQSHQWKGAAVTSKLSTWSKFYAYFTPGGPFCGFYTMLPGCMRFIPTQAIRMESSHPAYAAVYTICPRGCHPGSCPDFLMAEFRLMAEERRKGEERPKEGDRDRQGAWCLYLLLEKGRASRCPGLA